MSNYTNERASDSATDLNLIRDQCGALALELERETDPTRRAELARELAECRQRAFEVEQHDQPEAEREAGGPAAVRGDSERPAPFVTIEAADQRPDYAGLYAAKTAQARGRRDRTPPNVGASLNLPPAVKETVQRVERAQENATPAKKASAGRTLALSKQENKLLDVAPDIATTPPTGEDMAFTHAVLCHVGLPRAKVEGREFMRQSGAAWVNVQAGWLDEGKGPVQQSIPYGVMPRLALAWVSTYAVRHRTREIPIGDSAADFLRLMLGADTVGQGARYATLRKQMHALAACRLQLGFKGRTFNGQPVEQFDAWVSNRDSSQRPLSSMAGRDDALGALFQ